MARSKKSRTGGLIGQRKDPDFKLKREHKPSTVKKGRGQQSGSRQQGEAKVSSPELQPAASDKRIGSKKPIQLVSAAAVAAQQQSAKAKVKPRPEPEVLSPEKELALIESDDRLNTLVDRAEEGEVLSGDEQRWLDQQLQRHQALLEQLGLLEEDDDAFFDEAEDELPASNKVEERDDDALWQDFDQASLDDYKD